MTLLYNYYTESVHQAAPQTEKERASDLNHAATPGRGRSLTPPVACLVGWTAYSPLRSQTAADQPAIPSDRLRETLAHSEGVQLSLILRWT